MKRITAIAFAACAQLAGCEKKTDRLADFANVPAEQALLKINYASAYRANPSVQIKLNEVRTSSGLTYAYPFPGGGVNTGGGSDPLYFGITAGVTALRLSVAKTGTATDSIVLYNTTFTTEKSAYYTLHVADTGVNTQSVLVKENAVKPDTGGSVFRFVNLIPNLPSADLYFGGVKVAANVAYKGVSPYFFLSRFTPAGVFSVRAANAAPTSAAVTTFPNPPAVTTPPTPQANYAILNGRALTIFARGYVGIIGTTDVRRPQVSIYYIQ